MPAKKTKKAGSPRPKAARTSRVVNSDKAPQAIGPYSQARIANGFLFAAGQIAIDPATGQVVPGDIRAQTERALANLTAVLAAGGCSWNDVVRTGVFLKNFNDFAVMNETYARVLGDARPARSTVEVSALPRGVLVEIDLIAAVS